MPVAYESHSTSGESTSAVDAVLDKPTGTVAGDLLVAELGKRNDDPVSPPDGSWATIDELFPSTLDGCSVFWKVAGASEPSTYTFSWTNGTFQRSVLTRYSGGHATTPINAAAGVVDSSTPQTAPSVNTTVDGCLIVRLASQRNGSNAYTTIPGDDRWDLGQGGSGGIRVAAGDEQQVSAGATGTADFDRTNVNGTVWTIAIAPAAGGGGAIDLVVQDASHGHAADNLALTQEHALAVADAAHAHAAESPTLTQQHVIEVADTLHAHAAESPALTQLHQLAVQDAAHAHAADNVVLSQLHLLAVADALHALTDDGPITLAAGGTLDVADALHAHAADNLTLTQAHVLAVQDALHAHAAEGITLTQLHQLLVDSGMHAHTADNVVLILGDLVAAAGWRLRAAPRSWSLAGPPVARTSWRLARAPSTWSVQPL